MQNVVQNKTQKIIIDTDPGIDDAMAIMMALKEHKKGNINILAITLVYGNSTTDNARTNVLRVLELFDLQNQIPVFVGSSRGLVETYKHDGPPFHGDDGFGNTIFPNKPDLTKFNVKEPAALALMNLVNSFPDEITIIGLGPLTNLASCINADQSFSSRVKELMLMGGNSHGEGNITMCGEFNFHADPEAAKVVIDRMQCPICIVPWETCKNTNISWDWRKHLLGIIDSPQIEFLNRIEEMWYTNRYEDTWIPCDLFMMAVFFDETIIQESDTYKATVELHGEHTRGQLVLEKRGKSLKNSKNAKTKGSNEDSVDAGIVHVILEMDVEKLKQLIINALS